MFKAFIKTNPSYYCLSFDPNISFSDWYGLVSRWPSFRIKGTKGKDCFIYKDYLDVIGLCFQNLMIHSIKDLSVVRIREVYFLLNSVYVFELDLTFKIDSFKSSSRNLSVRKSSMKHNHSLFQWHMSPLS